MKIKSVWIVFSFLLLTLVACKKDKTETKAIFGAQSALEDEIRKGSKSPTILALSDWLGGFKIEESASTKKSVYNTALDSSDIKRTLGASSRKLILGFLADEQTRLKDLEIAASRNDIAAFDILLKKEAYELHDIAAALTFNFGRNYSSKHLLTKNKFARFLAARKSTDWIDVYAQDFLAVAFKDRASINAVKTQLRQEADNFHKTLKNFYIDGSAIQLEKVNSSLKSTRLALDQLKAILIDGKSIQQSDSMGSSGAMAKALSLASRAPDFKDLSSTSDASRSNISQNSATGKPPSLPFKGKAKPSGNVDLDLGTDALPKGTDNKGRDDIDPPNRLPPDQQGMCLVRCSDGDILLQCSLVPYNPNICGFGLVQEEMNFDRIDEILASRVDLSSEPAMSLNDELSKPCQELASIPNKQAFINCMRFSPTLVTQGSRPFRLNLFSLFSLSDTPPKTPAESFEVVEKQFSEMQNQGQEGACTAFGSAHTVISNVKPIDAAFEFDAWQLWNRYQDPQMESAARALQSANFVSKNGKTEVKVANIKPLKSLSEIKSTLVGGKAVWVASGVNNSWHAASGGGRDTIRCSGNDPQAGHAYSIVGYQDNDEYEGGGFVYIKNSWGPTWGLEGYAKLPYRCLTDSTPFPFQAYDIETECVRGCTK